MTELIITLLLLLGITVWFYNLLVKNRNQVEAAWSDIDVQLKRRHTLVPQLVEAVKAYASYEKATLEAVTELRKQSESTSSPAAKAVLEDAMESGLHKLVVLAESYPDLKADSNFRQLQEELVDTEDKIQYARRFYNGAVRILNTNVESFPALLVARGFGFKSAEFFEVKSDEERQAAKVDMD